MYINTLKMVLIIDTKSKKKTQGYKEKYKQTISKHYGFKNSIKTISTIIHNLTKLPVNTEINILWGIMTLNEREEMINIFIN